MAARRSRTFVQRPRQRRKLVWATSGIQTLSPPGGGNVRSVDLLGNFEAAGASTLGLTVMRTHAILKFTISAAADSWQYGFIIGRDIDVANNLPDPNGEPELDWMLLRQMWPHWSGATQNGVEVLDIDLRSKRKMEEMGQKYLFTARNSSVGANTVSISARTLVALP